MKKFLSRWVRITPRLYPLYQIIKHLIQVQNNETRNFPDRWVDSRRRGRLKLYRFGVNESFLSREGKSEERMTIASKRTSSAIPPIYKKMAKEANVEADPKQNCQQPTSISP